MRSSISKSGLFWLVIIIMILFMVLALPMQKPKSDVLTYSNFIQMVEAGEISEVKVRGQQISGKLANNSNFKTTGPEDSSATVVALSEHSVAFEIEEIQDSSLWYTALFTFVPLLVLVAVFMWFMRQVQGNNGRAMNFGKHKAKMQGDGENRVTFDDVAGIEESKEELAEIVDFLSDPEKFTRLGGRIPKGVLLMGSPGTGKTLLARAVAGEAGVPFFSISGSDFVEMFVGVGASRVRDLFEQGKKHSPCIIFIDEIDAVGRHRGAGMGGGHDEREQTLNALLVEMDGFEATDNVIIVAATNRPDVLDPALLRPGRFDRRIVVSNPDVRGREKILEIHTRKLPLNDDVTLQVIAKGTPGFTGADLENLCNEAALLAARKDKTQVDHSDFLDAREKITLGPERRSMVMPEWEKRNTAYHEAGHAIVAHLLPDYDPVHKVTIVPRGRALGVTWTLPNEDRLSETRTGMHRQITMALGGRAAEEVAMKSLTGGAYSDIKTATAIARRMVCDLGMSEELGPVSWGEGNSDPFLGRQMTRMQSYSEHTARRIDDEVRRILMRANEAAKGILEANIHVLHAVADALLEQESLDGEEFAALVDAAGPVPPTGMQWMGVA